MAMIMAATAGRFLPWKEEQKKVSHQHTPFPGHKKDLVEPLKPPPHGLEWYQLGDQEWELRTVQHTPFEDQDTKNQEQHEEKNEDGGEYVHAAKAKATSKYDEKEEEKEENDNAAKDKDKSDGEQEEKSMDAGPRTGVRVPDVSEKVLKHIVTPEDTLAGICIRYKVNERELRALNGFVGNHFRTCSSLVLPNRVAASQKPKQIDIDLEPRTKEELLQRSSVTSRLGLSRSRNFRKSKSLNLDDKAFKDRGTEKAWESQQGIVHLVHIAPPSTPRPRRHSLPPQPPQTPRNWLRRRGLSMLGRSTPRAAPVGGFKGGSSRRLRRSTSHVESVSGTACDNGWPSTGEPAVNEW